VFLVNSRYPRFAATFDSSSRKADHHRRHTFSRSYGANLPSSFTRVISSALVFSTYPPVSVYGTDAYAAPFAAFLGSIGSTSSFSEEKTSSHLRDSSFAFNRTKDPYMLEPGIPAAGSPTFLRPCSFHR
jgi:hypothetical protein